MRSRRVDVVTARAIHLAMGTTFDAAAAARELVDVAEGSEAVLDAALLRVDRALLERWSIVAERAGEALREAVAMAPHAPVLHVA